MNYGIKWNERIGSAIYPLICAEVALIPVPAVAKSVTALNEARATMREAQRARDAAQAEVRAAEASIERAAVDLAVKKKKLPADIRQPLKDARDEAEQAQLVARATTAAFIKAHGDTRAVFEANRDALEAAALADAKRAVDGMAAARVTYENAARRAAAAFGVLGMYAEADGRGILTPIYREATGSRRGMYSAGVSEAFGNAIGHSAIELERYSKGLPAVADYDVEVGADE